MNLEQHTFAASLEVTVILPHQMSCEYLRAALDGIVKGRVVGGALHLGVDIHLHAQQKYDALEVLVQHRQMQEVLAPSIHLKNAEC